MPRYADTMTLLAAGAAFFEQSGLGADGGYDARWRSRVGVCLTPGRVLNLGAFVVGLFRAPRRLFHAFVRGRRARNLYHGVLAQSERDDITVGALRERLGVRARNERARASDVVAFVTWCGVAVAYHAGAIALALAVGRLFWAGLRR